LHDDARSGGRCPPAVASGRSGAMIAGRSPVLRVIGKEIRALSFAFGASAAGMALASTARFRMFAEPAYLLGVASLGALSIGHEYSHHTVAQMLAQPMRRAQLLSAKLGVLAVMLAVLAPMAWVVFTPRSTESERLALVLLPVVVAFSLAPWFTMLCR